MSNAAIWVAVTVFILITGTAWVHIDWNRKADRLRARRPNPSQLEFVDKLLSHNVERSVAEWLWQRLSPEWKPNLTPHPDDNLLTDLPFDFMDPEDWQEDFCEAFGLDVHVFSKWPDGAESTIANMAKWYSDEVLKQGAYPTHRQIPAGT